jgi:hypothetical protein
MIVGGRAIVAVDPTSMRLEGRRLTPATKLVDLAVAADDVWVLRQQTEATWDHMEVLDVDQATGTILRRFPAGRDSEDVAAGLGAVWVGEWKDQIVRRIDARTGSIHDTPVPFQPDTIRVGLGAVWVSGQASGGGTSMVRLDRAGRVTDSWIGLHVEAIGAGGVWVEGTGAPNGAVRRLSPRTGQLSDALLHTPITPISVAASDDRVWVARWAYYCKLHSPLPEGPPIVTWQAVELDPRTLQPIGEPIWFGGTNTGSTLQFAFGSLWTPGLKGMVHVDVSGS